MTRQQQVDALVCYAEDLWPHRALSDAQVRELAEAIVDNHREKSEEAGK